MAFDPKNAVDVKEDSGGGFNISRAVDVQDEKSDSLFNKFYSNLSAKQTKPLSMIGAGDVALNPLMTVPRLASSGLGVPEENLFPVAGQLAGGMIPGAGYTGSVAGASIGQAARQMARGLRGESPKASEVAKEAMITAAVEGTTRLPAAVLFKKARAMTGLREGAGKELSNIKNSLKSVNDAIEVDDILAPMKNGLKEITVARGQQAGLMKAWISKLESIKASGKKISGKVLMEIEDQFGEAARYYSKVGGEVVQTDIKNPALNNLVKSVRNLASSKVDDLAISLGYKNFPKLSKEVSKLITTAESKNQSLLRTSITSGALGGLVGTASNNASLGFLTSGLGIAAMNPALGNIGYRTIEKTGLGRAATLGLSDAIRRSLEEKK